MRKNRSVPGENAGGRNSGPGVGSQDGQSGYGKTYIQCKKIITEIESGKANLAEHELIED